ncbi:down syndrome cell adhesion molecule-like protein Dscam2 [Caerostris extrusa]|uniref:Down syndrome cell adhesion molecule-like protein Dscam2 n=1 Tax=Caerostris extrusa TaxID=172846 RepID=A0AAV4WVK4_CAEEX|nr:down syndrome cell adhesion molecule-like protein Dscam2 [Caerostris extrusa]
MDLIPGTWYSLLMTARNDAGSTDAEIPSLGLEVSDLGGSFYRHLLITVPVISSALVLLVVFCVICLITRRRTSVRRTLSSDVVEGNDPVKPESMPLFNV